MNLVPEASAYRAAFELERARDYPLVTALERRVGIALPRERLEAAARVLACPVKARPPNWQHGRVIYALTVAALTGDPGAAPVTLVDIGTAKGFSALCLEWARRDVGIDGRVVSIDVVDPGSRVRRNTVADCEGLTSLPELLAPWPEARAIEFVHDTGIDYLARTAGRIRVAFVDGKHTHEVVKREGFLLSDRQYPGDLVIFDDVQIPGVRQAVAELGDVYAAQILTAHAERQYAIAARR